MSPDHTQVVEPSGGLAELLDVGTRRVSALLHAGIPLSLLLDLAEPNGPDSAQLYRAEGRDGRSR